MFSKTFIVEINSMISSKKSQINQGTDLGVVYGKY